MQSRHLLVKGKVQGVFFRASAKKVAESLELAGWIKNVPSGDVEAVISGTEDKVQAFIEWCHHGPAEAKVTEVIVTARDEVIDEGFTIIK
ncbi:MAG: acylphosphatase [Flaviaesturariibacter sp.]|nr:acylphosphatase [Flaviaesturariibacter sp.]